MRNSNCSSAADDSPPLHILREEIGNVVRAAVPAARSHMLQNHLIPRSMVAAMAMLLGSIPDLVVVVHLQIRCMEERIASCTRRRMMEVAPAGGHDAGTS